MLIYCYIIHMMIKYVRNLIFLGVFLYSLVRIFTGCRLQVCFFHRRSFLWMSFAVVFFLGMGWNRSPELMVQ